MKCAEQMSQDNHIWCPQDTQKQQDATDSGLKISCPTCTGIFVMKPESYEVMRAGDILCMRGEDIFYTIQASARFPKWARLIRAED